MKGPFRSEWLEHYLSEKAPGVFLCSNDGETILEIGRSDDDLKEMIKKTCTRPRGLDSLYAYFWFQYTQTPKEAFYLHCQLWHKYKRNNSTAEHPQPPLGFEDLTCPIKDCEWNRERRGLKEEKEF